MMENTEEDRQKLMAILAGEDVARRKYLGSPWKLAMEKAIEFQLEFKAEIVANPNSPDADFFASLKDICLLNMMRDDLSK